MLVPPVGLSKKILLDFSSALSLQCQFFGNDDHGNLHEIRLIDEIIEPLNELV